MDKKFCRTVLHVEILTEAGTEIPEDLDELHELITYGHASGEVTTVLCEEDIDASTMAQLLAKQRSDPEFLLGDALDRCPECNDQGNEQPYVDGDYVEYRCPSCERIWKLPRTVLGNYEPTRHIEFVCILDNSFCEFIIEDVPVEVRWDELQTWAEQNLATQARFRKCLRIFPWGDEPEGENNA